VIKPILGQVTGVLGMMLILGGYYLLWISPGTEPVEVILRTRIAIVMNLSGAVLFIYYLYKK